MNTQNEQGYQTQELNNSRETAAARYLRSRLAELGQKPSEFCQASGFDQSLLSKLMNSHLRSVNLESALKLAIGLKVPPRQIFELFGKEQEWSGVITAAAALQEAA